MDAFEQLRVAIEAREGRVMIVGLGYAGLPLAVAFAEAGLSVGGYDRDRHRVEQVRKGLSYSPDVEDQTLGPLVDAGRVEASAQASILDRADVAVLCVPTPLDADGRPDTTFVETAAADIASHLRPGRLVVVESTSYPGTTEELVGGILAAHGLRPGREVFLAFSSERVDPGNPRWHVRDIPKVVGAVDGRSLALARLLYAQIAPRVVAVSSPAAAEMAKLVENLFRDVNIAMANEVARACDHLGLDAWEVIDAAATKPFGFMAFYPGPGRGGHCIPADPVYLDWRLRQHGFRSRLIEAARDVNDDMPAYVAQRVERLLEERGVLLAGAQVLLLGVSYKRDVADTRHSPAITLIEALKARGAAVSYHDPHVPSVRVNGDVLHSGDLRAGLDRSDCAVVVADHSAYDWDEIAGRAACVLDCRGALRHLSAPHVVGL